jgi:hypothetical protein
MSDRSGLSRGDGNRNARLARLRQLLPAGNAIVGIDLADDKQAAVVTDHDSRVIARRRVSARARELGGLLEWAVGKAAAAGFASVTVAWEPTGHRWRVLDQLAAERGLASVPSSTSGSTRGAACPAIQDRLVALPSRDGRNLALASCTAVDQLVDRATPESSSILIWSLSSRM